MNQRYTDPVIAKYIELIKSKTSVFKEFYQGEPTRVPGSNLPCCIISKRETNAGKVTNAEDGHEIGLEFIVIADIRTELSTSDNDSKLVEGVSLLYDIIEGRNADYTLKSESLLNILRNNQIVDSAYDLRTDLSTVTKVLYGDTLRSRDPEEWTIEARIQLIANFIQIR